MGAESGSWGRKAVLGAGEELRVRVLAVMSQCE